MGSGFMYAHESWLSIAQEDLASAKHLSTIPFMTALFHTQQCAEKALKAYIVFKKNSFTKTHDLVRLVDICMEMDEDFETLRLFAAVLTPYEIAGRYPSSDFVRLNVEEIEKIIKQSEFIFNFVMLRINKSRYEN
jgi:HEPN domain-containing protein